MMTTPFCITESKVVPLTRELALEFRDLEASPTERELDPSRVNHLRQKAEAGLFVPPHWATAQLGNRRLRMNGRHSSTMLTSLDGAFPEGLSAHIDEFRVSDENGLALLFRQFDDRKSGRTPTDVSGAYQGLYEPLRGVNRKVAKLGIEGVAWWRRTIEGAPTPAGDDVYTLFGELGLHGFIGWISTIFDIKTPEMEHAAVVAAMYATFIASDHGAREFWSAVANGGVQFDDDAPVTVLDDWLKKLKDPSERQAIADIKPAQRYQGCIYAWNAFRQNHSLKEIRYNTSKGWFKVVH